MNEMIVAKSLDVVKNIEVWIFVCAATDTRIEKYFYSGARGTECSIILQYETPRI